MKNGTHVRLADGRTGFVCGSGLDGLTVHLDEGRITQALPKDVVEIPPPTPTDPPPVQPGPKNFQTCHEPPSQIAIPQGVSVLRNGQWSNNTWPLGEQK